MSTLVGVLPLVELSDGSWAALRALHVLPTRGNAARAWIEVGGWPQAEELARRVSTALNGRALALAAQTAADTYLVAEYESGALRRRIAYDRDGDGWGPLEGTARDWESDFHFARPLDAVIDDLRDDDAPDAELIAATKRAYASRDVRALTRLPRPNGRGIANFLVGRGVDPSAGPDARYRAPSLLGRLFGRR